MLLLPGGSLLAIRLIPPPAFFLFVVVLVFRLRSVDAERLFI